MNDNELLPRLVDILDEATLEDGFGFGNRLVRVEIPEGDTDAFDLGFRDIEEHPTRALLGFTAPPSWRVLGLIGGAWAGPLADPGELQTRPSAHPDGARVRMIILQARTGVSASRLRWPDGRIIESPGEGMIEDCLRRAVGLGTAPPAAAASEFVAVQWVEGVLGRESKRVRRGPPPAPVAGWEEIRHLLAQGTRPATYGLTSDEVEWMDAGILSRWLLGAHKPLGVLLRDVDNRFTPAIARRVRSTVSVLLEHSHAA